MVRSNIHVKSFITLFTFVERSQRYILAILSIGFVVPDIVQKINYSFF